MHPVHHSQSSSQLAHQRHSPCPGALLTGPFDLILRFPHFRSLSTLRITSMNKFLKAIVVPNLNRLVYFASKFQGRQPLDVFVGLESKFDGVCCLRFSWIIIESRDR